MHKSSKPAPATLQRIADALGVPVECFLSRSVTTDTEACLYWWSRITTQEGRRRAVDALRRIADTEPK